MFCHHIVCHQKGVSPNFALFQSLFIYFIIFFTSIIRGQFIHILIKRKQFPSMFLVFSNTMLSTISSGYLAPDDNIFIRESSRQLFHEQYSHSLILHIRCYTHWNQGLIITFSR